MAKDKEAVKKLGRKFVQGSLIVVAANVPVWALIIWAVKFSGDTLNNEAMRWPIVLVCLGLIAFELWLGYQFMLKPVNEIARLPDVGASERKE